jgi:hypothetical protein
MGLEEDIFHALSQRDQYLLIFVGQFDPSGKTM